MSEKTKFSQIVSRINGGGPRIKRVPLNELTVDIRVQQPLREGKVREFLRRGYDPALVGTIVVSERENGTKVVLDGQTRAEVARRAGAEDILALVWTGLTLEQEAFLFTYLNRKSNPTAVSTFKTRVVAGEDVPNGIIGTLNRYGWHIDDSKTTPGSFAAVTAAERIYRAKGDFHTQRPGSQVFDRTIQTITEAWGNDKAASDAGTVSGIAHFLIRYWDEVDHDRLVRALSKVTAERFRAESKAVAKAINAKPVTANAYNVYQEYNKRGRSKLEAFSI